VMGKLDLLHPSPHSSNLPSTDFSADRHCLRGRIGVRGMGYHATGRTIDSHGGGEGEGGGDEGWGGGKGGTMPYMDLERLTFNIDYEAFKQ
jgi:hypothetical protein